jgi:hypothetical protein
MVLLSAHGMDVAAIARVAFTSEDRVRDVIGNFNADGFSPLYPRYRGARPGPQRPWLREVDVARLSPLVRHHVNVLGRYSFQLPGLPGGLRPLREPGSGQASVADGAAFYRLVTLPSGW